MAVINLFPVVENERITAMVAVDEFKPGDYLVMATYQGEVKRMAADNFTSVRSSGLIAMDLAVGDELVAVGLASDQSDVILVTQKGQSIRFAVSALRASSRISGGVRGIRLASGDRVVSMDVTFPDAYLLVVTTEGFGKLTPVSEYPYQHRAGSGVRTFKLTEKTGEVATARLVSLSQQLMIISADGLVIRTPVKGKEPRSSIPIQKRGTQGARLMRLGEGDKVVAIACFD